MLPITYQLDLPKDPQAVIFVNGFIARNRTGFFWMWRNLSWIRSSTAKAEGCTQVKAGICGFREVVMVSYWKDHESLINFFRSKPHGQMMQFIVKNADSLDLYNETYSPTRSGKYINDPHGMATIFSKVKTGE